MTQTLAAKTAEAPRIVPSAARAPTRPENQPGNTTRVIVVAITLLAVAVIIWRISDALVILFGGIVLGAALWSLATFVRRWTKCREHVALAAVVTTLVFLLGVSVWIFGKQMGQQASELEEALPKQLHRVGEWLRNWEVGRTVIDSLEHSTGDGKFMAQVGMLAGATVNVGVDLVFMVFLGIYFAADPDLYLTGGLRLIPPARRGQVRHALLDAGDSLRSWLGAQLIAMAVIGVVVWISLTILGVPLALLLGVLAALFEFVPVVGPILFALPGILMALSKSPQLALSTAIMYFVVQQLEGNVLIPLLQRWAARLPPVISLFAVAAGGLLLGPKGVVFAAPLAVVVMTLVQHLYVEDTLEHGRK